jgi:hypothetical protein
MGKMEEIAQWQFKLAACGCSWFLVLGFLLAVGCWLTPREVFQPQMIGNYLFVNDLKK